MTEETQKFVEKVDTLIKNGDAKNISAACRSLGKPPTKYYSAMKGRIKVKTKKAVKTKLTKRARGYNTRKVRVIDIPVTAQTVIPNRLILVAGSATELVEFAKGLAR